jgi:hypothetical protein
VDLDRQELPERVTSRPRPPQRLPETNPPVLGDWFIYLSVVVLAAGIIVITALNFGADVRSPIVRFPALIGAGLLVVLSADAGVRVWRSAWAWLPIDRPRGLARFVWAAVMAAVFVASLASIVALLTL